VADETPDTPTEPGKKKSPDGLAVAIQTEFTDDPMHLGDVTKSWLAITSRGISAYLTVEQVADWIDV
jgi:hypothetical protein